MGDRKARVPSNSRVLHHAISRPATSAVDMHKHSLLKSILRDKTPTDQGYSTSVKALAGSEPRQPSTAQSPAQTRKLSPLERLPIEILETIFMQTLNFNLIRASPYLASKLSSFYVRKELVIRTCSSRAASVYPSAIAPLFPNDKDLAEVQTTLLRQKWLTLAFLRRCIPDYMTSILLHEFSAHRLRWIDPKGPIVTPKFEASIREFVQSLFSRAIASPYGSPDGFTEINWTEEDSGRNVTLYLAPREGVVVLCIDNNPKYHYRILCLSTQCRIPDRLLRGPWSDDKCELLDITVRGNATINWISTTSGEVAEAGFWDALKERNTNALRALIVRIPSSTTFVMSRGVGIVPRQEHLVFAIKNGCQEDIVDVLLNAPSSLATLQEREILKLRSIMEGQQHPQAHWLKERIESDMNRRRGRA